jgi:8-oxo-dGTP pyrophosphatase MutT (NUDIX family)
MYEALKYSLKNYMLSELPGSDAHCKMLPPGRRLKTYSHELSSLKMSSVLVLLYPEGDRLFTCLTKRPSTMKHHPGQISFPGGKVEKDDLSAEMTALREAREEVGIDPSTIEILGKLSDLYVEVSKFSIQPFLAWADQKPDFIIDYREVDELILFPVSDFLTHETILETELQTVSGLLSVRYYPFRDEIIWGATAMIIAELIEILKR